MKCEYCGAMMDSTAKECPNCGAVNQNMVRAAEGTPKTIEELKQWYIAHNLPSEETTRFFIGKDYKGARAFGIYKDGNRCIVYKNKADGSRAIRYSGTDEAYAVNEIYLKLKSEILNQKSHNANRAYAPRSARRYPKIKAATSLGQFILPLIGCFPFLMAVLFDTVVSSLFLGFLLVGMLYLGIYFLWKLLGRNPQIADKQYRLKKNAVWRTCTSTKIKVFLYVILALITSMAIYGSRLPSYYQSTSSGNIYCTYDNHYFLYSSGDWIDCGEDYGNHSDWTETNSYTYYDNNYVDFEDSNYYSDNYSVDWSSDWSSYDSDYSWDSGSSWDSGWSSGGWDSDW